MNAEDTVFGRGTQRDQLAAERSAEANAVGFEADVTFLVGLADQIVGPVFDRRQGLRKRAAALPIPLARRGHRDRLMRPLVIVDLPPAVERALTRGQIREGGAVQDLGLERAMKAFVLALGLRMVGPAVRHAHAQAHKPYRKRRERAATGITPGSAIVHEHRIGQPVTSKHRDQAFARRPILLRAAGLHAQSVTGMVVDHGQRMAAPAPGGKIALEIHLPELVGLRALKTLIRTGMLGPPLLQLAVPAQNLGDRARRRNNLLAVALQHLGDLAPAPRVVARLPNAHNLGFHRIGCAQRAAMRPTRAIDKPAPPFRRIALKPLVAFGATDAEPSAQFPLVRSRPQRKPHEILPLIHDRQLPQRHRVPPVRRNQAERVAPMSPNAVPHVPSPYRSGGEGWGGGRVGRLRANNRPPTPTAIALRALAHSRRFASAFFKDAGRRPAMPPRQRAGGLTRGAAAPEPARPYAIALPLKRR